MMAVLLEPFGYGYMVTAIWVSALVGGLCAFLSVFLMLKGWSLIGDPLSHAIVPGVAGAYMLGLPFALGAFFSGGLAALAILGLGATTRLRQDVVIGVVFTGFFSLGLFMISLRPVAVSSRARKKRLGICCGASRIACCAASSASSPCELRSQVVPSSNHICASGRSANASRYWSIAESSCVSSARARANS